MERQRTSRRRRVRYLHTSTNSTTNSISSATTPPAATTRGQNRISLNIHNKIINLIYVYLLILHTQTRSLTHARFYTGSQRANQQPAALARHPVVDQQRKLSNRLRCRKSQQQPHGGVLLYTELRRQQRLSGAAGRDGGEVQQ